MSQEKAKFIYQLKEGESWCFYDEKIIISHPDRHPKSVDVKGKIVEIIPYKERRIYENNSH